MPRCALQICVPIFPSPENALEKNIQQEKEEEES